MSGKLLRMAVVVCAMFVLVAPVAGQVKGLYYQEAVKDGRIHVFNTPERYKLWQASGDMGPSITLIGRGPNGETVVAENETAIDLYLFKHGLPAYDRPTPPPPAAARPTFPQVKIGGLWYLSYQDGESGNTDTSKFTIKRGYINVEAKITPWMSARITPDTTIDSSGDIKVRLKYAYAKFASPDLGFVTRPEVEVGVAHMPWLDFEEHINNYRLQDTMFMERNGLFNSADVGVTFMGLLGGTVSDEYQTSVSKDYPGKWGSFAFGVYNGGGYHASEANTDKVIEGRLTVRPLPEIVPGLQISYFGVRGKGNTAAEPDWTLDAAMLSFEHRHFVLTGTLADGEGNQKGDAVDASGTALRRDGWSVFAEVKLGPKWGLIGRYDAWDPNTQVDNDGNERTVAGVVYHLGKGNDVLLDYDTVSHERAGKPDDSRVQLTLQVKF
ncbi:MAG: hypothetical protein AB1625_04335 [Acidobacteriota bacterium]